MSFDFLGRRYYYDIGERDAIFVVFPDGSWVMEEQDRCHRHVAREHRHLHTERDGWSRGFIVDSEQKIHFYPMVYEEVFDDDYNLSCCKLTSDCLQGIYEIIHRFALDGFEVVIEFEGYCEEYTYREERQVVLAG